MKPSRVVLIIVALCLSATAFADRPAPERQYSVASANGAYEFTMYPSEHSSDASIPPHGAAFRVVAAEVDPLWTVDGWYSFETFLSNDGHHLVRVGPWASLSLNEELAIAFYRDGQQLRRYLVADLIDDPDSVQRSVSHYSWQKRERGFPRLTPEGRFELLTVEDRVLAFDVSNGTILGENSSTESASVSVRVTREDADDLYLAANLFRENGIEVDERTITRVIRGAASKGVWVSARFADLPIFYHEIRYSFDSRRKVRMDPNTGEPRVLGPPIPESAAFPIDHRPDIETVDAAQTWLERARADQFLGPEYQPRNASEVILGFYNLRTGRPGDPVYRLAWRVRPKGSRYPVAMISAKKGDVLHFDSGVRTSGGVAPLPSTDSSAPRKEDYVGVWVRLACSGRERSPQITIRSDHTFKAGDRESDSGRWRLRGDGMIELLAVDDGGPTSISFPGALRLERSTGRLQEAIPGSARACEYRRSEAANEVRSELPLVCFDAVQDKVAWNYSGRTRWQAANVARLCAGAEASTEPARCFEQVLHSNAEQEAGASWGWQPVLELCAGTKDADAVIACFESEIAQGANRSLAASRCEGGGKVDDLADGGGDSLTPEIITVFACGDYCPGPREKYLERVFSGVVDEQECLDLGGRPMSYYGWGETKLCLAE